MFFLAAFFLAVDFLKTTPNAVKPCAICPRGDAKNLGGVGMRQAIKVQNDTARSASESEARNWSSTRCTSPSLPRLSGSSEMSAVDRVILFDRFATLRRHASAVFNATR